MKSTEKGQNGTKRKDCESPANTRQEDGRLPTNGIRARDLVWRKLRNDFILLFLLLLQKDPSSLLDNIDNLTLEDRKNFENILLGKLYSVELHTSEYYAILVLIKFLRADEACKKYRNWTTRCIDFESLCKKVRIASEKVINQLKTDNKPARDL